MELDSGRLERRGHSGDDAMSMFSSLSSSTFSTELEDSLRSIVLLLTVVIVVTFVTSARRTSVTSLVRSLSSFFF